MTLTALKSYRDPTTYVPFWHIQRKGTHALDFYAKTTDRGLRHCNIARRFHTFSFPKGKIDQQIAQLHSRSTLVIGTTVMAHQSSGESALEGGGPSSSSIRRLLEGKASIPSTTHSNGPGLTSRSNLSFLFHCFYLCSRYCIGNSTRPWNCCCFVHLRPSL